MAKEAYYFSHDANARRDPKILAMRSEFGNEGYGWYWILIEVMSEQEGYKLKHKWVSNAIAMEMLCDANTAEKFVNSCINDYELFESDGEHFWSNSLLRRMNIKEEKRRKRSEAGKKGAQKRWNDNVSNNNDSADIAKPKQTHSNAIAKDGKGKESKVKESKRNNYSAEFEQFWSIYPRRIDKQRAFKSFNAKMKTYDIETILSGTKRYVAYLSKNNTETQFIKHATTFLNNESFLDDYQEVTTLKRESSIPSQEVVGEEDFPF